MTLADAEAVLEDFRTQDAVLEAAKSEATMREALLARLQAETESSARRLRDPDEAHALLTAEIRDLRQALAKSKSQANGLAEETTALNEALTSAKAEELEWNHAAETLKQMRPNDAAVGVGERGTGNQMFVLELECALEALTTPRAELHDVGARPLETQHRAARASTRHPVAAAAIAAIRPAKFNIFLAPKRHAARPAIAGANINFRLVEKFHLLILWLQINGICRKIKKPDKQKRR